MHLRGEYVPPILNDSWHPEIECFGHRSECVCADCAPQCVKAGHATPGAAKESGKGAEKGAEGGGHEYVRAHDVSITCLAAIITYLDYAVLIMFGQD